MRLLPASGDDGSGMLMGPRVRRQLPDGVCLPLRYVLLMRVNAVASTEPLNADDNNALFTCPASRQADYTVTFCPAS